MAAPPVQVRGPRLVEKVLQVTLEEVGRVGFAALSVETVAALAGVNKTTIYRRWPTKFELVRAALDCVGQDVTDLPDTGSLRGDLLALATALMRSLETPGGRALYGRIVSGDGPELAEVIASLYAETGREHAIIVERAIARGELPEGSDPVLIIEMMVGSLIHFAFMVAVPARRRRHEQIVDLLLTGALRGGAIPAGRAAAARATAKAPRRPAARRARARKGPPVTRG